MSNKQYDELLEQIDSYILNTLAHASMTPYEISASLDGFLDRYHISLRTITHRLNELQLDCMIACICPEANPERSFFSLRIPVEDVPMFHLDDKLIDDLCDALNLMPVYNSTDNVYLSDGEDGKPILHIEEEELVILEVDVEDEEIIADLNNAEQNNEDDTDEPSALPQDDEVIDEEEIEAEADAEYNEAINEPNDEAIDEAPYSDDDDEQEANEVVADQDNAYVEEDTVEKIAEGEEVIAQVEEEVEEYIIPEAETAQEELDEESVEDDDCTSEEVAAQPAQDNAVEIDENPIETETSQDDTAEVEIDSALEETTPDVEVQEEPVAVEEEVAEEAEGSELTDDIEEPEDTQVSTDIAEDTYEKVAEDTDDEADAIVEADTESIESVEETMDIVAEVVEDESVERNISDEDDAVDEGSVADDTADAVVHEQASEDTEETEQEEIVEDTTPVRRMAFSRADIQQELEDNPETREKRLASMRLLGLIGDQPEEEIAQEIEEEPVEDTAQTAENEPSPAMQSYSAVLRPQNDLEYYLQEVETEKHYAYKSVLHNLFHTNYAPKAEADVDTKITMEECSSFSEFREEMRKKGYDVRQYVVQHTVQYYSKKYINVNSIAFATACLTYLLAVALLLVGFFAFDKYASLGYKPYLCTGLVLFAIPIFYGVRYLAYKDKHAPATFSFKLSFATAFMVSLILSMVFLLVAFFYPRSTANISDVNTLIAPVFYPAAMLLLIPISVVIYALLYRTRKFYVI